MGWREIWKEGKSKSGEALIMVEEVEKAPGQDTDRLGPEKDEKGKPGFEKPRGRARNKAGQDTETGLCGSSWTMEPVLRGQAMGKGGGHRANPWQGAGRGNPSCRHCSRQGRVEGAAAAWPGHGNHLCFPPGKHRRVGSML